MENKPGLWICIDGPDFTGKGTQTAQLLSALVRANEDNVIVYTHEPTRNARAIKEKLKREVGDAYKDPMLMAQLYVEDRARNEREVIMPILKAGGIVVSNRHKYSTLAYQNAQGVDFDDIIALHKKHRIGTPDITFFLFVDDDEELRSRMARTGKTGDKFENDFNFQRIVDVNYKSISQMAPTDKEFFGEIHTISKHPSIGVYDVFDCIWQKLEPVYNRWTKQRDS